MAQNFDLTQTGPELQNRIDQVTPNEQNIATLSTSVSAINGYVSDKSYDASTFSGFARKNLTKNIVGSQNILTQSMLQAANTIYIIQYDFDLNGQTITVPANCVLKFEGGSLSGGTLVGQNTSIDADAKTIFKNLKLDGNFDVESLRASWFGIYPGAQFKSSNDSAIGGCYTYSVVATKTAMYFDQEGTYIFGTQIVTSNRHPDGFKDVDIFGVSTDTVLKIETAGYPVDMINLINAENIKIHDLSLTEQSSHPDPIHGVNGISLITTAKNITIYNVNVYDLPYLKAGSDASDGGNAFTFQSNVSSSEGCINLNIYNCAVNRCASLFQISFHNSVQNLICNVHDCYAKDVLSGLQVYNTSPLINYPKSFVMFTNNHVEKCKVGVYTSCGQFLNVINNIFTFETPELPILDLFDNMGAFQLSGLKNSVISNNQLREYTGENAISIIPISGGMTYNDDPSEIIFNENVISGNINSFGINIRSKIESLKTISTKNNIISGFGIAESNMPTLNQENIFIVLSQSASYYLKFISLQDYLTLNPSGYTLIGVGFVYDSKIIVVSVAEAKKEFGTFSVVDSFKTSNILNAAKDDKGKLNTYYLYNNNSSADTAVGYCVTHNTDVDWHLPSVAEMAVLFQNKDLINKTLSVIGGAIIRDDFYWTSTKISSTHTYAFNMAESQFTALSNSSLWVKPIFVFESDYYITNLTTPGFYKGDTRYYPTLNKHIIWNGTNWVDDRGYYPGPHKGDNNSRMTLIASLGAGDVGYDFYDTDDNKIYYFGYTDNTHATKCWKSATLEIEY